ncbi:MAG: aminotransferase PglE [Brockia lithotrophica]|uniref:Aminotransferase PglE n=1 Tax=Brockia lithotrophica TaxID=933949 RepID=A0A2T5G4V6_9BACL|nr:MAG: aminotransferase PglE [Brockia lithotrophica]
MQDPVKSHEDVKVRGIFAMRDSFLPFSPPMIGEEEIREVIDTLRSEWITTGPKTKEFERRFQEFLGAPGALALNSCTAALHTALVTLGIGPGDEVVTTPHTFAATANVIEHVGARPVLVDVEPDTLNIDPSRIEAALTPRTRAILPVHFAGHPADLDPIREIAQKHGLALIEDAAHALPARYRGRMIGSGPNPVAFSFYATKNLTTAEGGMLTGAPDFLERASIFALHGMTRDAWKRYGKEGSWYYEVTVPGFKYNMTDIQASLGLHQLKKLPEFHRRRREIAARYTAVFSEREELVVPVERPDVEHAWHLYVLRLNLSALTIDRSRFIEELKRRNIGTSVHFIPIHLHPYYREKYGYRPEDFPVSYENYLRSISLPLHPGLGDRDVEDVIEAVLDVVREFRR